MAGWKIGRPLVAVALASALLAGCADTNGSEIAYPEVELPPFEGDDVFAGKTFMDGDERYVFSDDRTVDFYQKGKKARACQYSVNKDGELCLKVEKIVIFYENKMFSFAEAVRYVESGDYFADSRAYGLEWLNSGDSKDVLAWIAERGMTPEEYVERVVDGYKEDLAVQKKFGYPDLKQAFAYHRYKVEDCGSRWIWTEQYEESSAEFGLAEPTSVVAYLEVCPGRGSAFFAPVLLDNDDEYDNFYSYSVSDGKMTFVNQDGVGKVKEFPASYEIRGSGNNSELVISFVYDGTSCSETLDFKPEEIRLTEVSS